jgi:quercetin dioxygenase-like cupin family protein
MADLRVLYRGAYASKDLKAGTLLRNNYFLAMPNSEGQLVAKDLGKFKKFTLKNDVKANKPIMAADTILDDTKSAINLLRQEIKEIIHKSSLTLPKNITLEISHHYGLQKFREMGAGLIHLINREYSKIIVVMLPNQNYPLHKHNLKDETYYILYGQLKVTVNDKFTILAPGQTFSVERGTSHCFSALNEGVVFEEIATTYIKGDSVYEDELINSNSERKTLIRL